MALLLKDGVKVVVIVILMFAIASPAMAALYKCLDKQNRTIYQDKPCTDMTVARLPSSLSKMGAKQENRTFFWKATAGKGTLNLLGSLQYGEKAAYSLPQIVSDAFNRAEVLVVEADIQKVSAKEMFDVMQGKGRYLDKSKLEDHIKPGTWKKTTELAKQLGVDEESLQLAKPWLAALMLNAQYLSQQGYKSEFSVDTLLIQQAQGKKTIIEMENLEAEIDLIDQFPEPEQEQMLLHTLKQLSKGEEYHRNNINAWEEGDAEAMDLIVRQSFDPGQLGSKLYKTFLIDRNERMANRLVDLANDGRTYFVVLGADHLGGEKGILKLLGQKGFTITQP